MADDHTLLQIIHADGSFTDNLDDGLKRWDIYDKGNDYKVIAVLGVQSSGKSTMLNYLFDTKFAVMNSDVGQQQTTLGIWVGRSPENNILVFDVEGTDSEERGDDAVSFERKTSLFSLALAEILVLNIWSKDIGRKSGSNLELLKNVMELNLSLFGVKNNKKTLLLFCLRDYDGKTPRDKLFERLNDSVNKIWESITKPEEVGEQPLTDFFEVEYTAFSHKIYQTEAFESEMLELRHRLSDVNHEKYLWRPSMSNDVPADGFATFARRIWEVINTNRDLDLPTEKIMLATFRCDEILRETLASIYEGPYNELLELSRGPEIISDFGEQATAIHSAAIENYGKLAIRYHKETSEAKAAELSNKISTGFSVIFNDQIAKIAHQQIDAFDSALQALVPKAEEKLCPNFLAEITTLKEKVLHDFNSKAEENLLAEVEPAWRFDGELRTFVQNIDNRLRTERDAQLRKLVFIIKNRLKVELKDQLAEILEAGTPSLWKDVRALKEKVTTKVDRQFREAIAQIVEDQNSVKDRHEEILTFVDSLFFESTKEFAANIHETAMVRFEKRFKYDNKGLPKRWGRTDIIPDKYQADLDFASSIIQLVSIYRVDERFDDVTHETEDLPAEIIIISKRDVAKIKERLTSSADALYKQALIEQERETNIASLYPFIAIFMLVFAWDELWYLFTSPFLMFFTVIIASISFALYYTKAYIVLLPIVFTVRDSLVEKAKQSSGLSAAIEKVKALYEQHLAPKIAPYLAQAAGARSSVPKDKQE